MKLMTQEIRDRIPKLYETEDTPLAEKVIHAKYFHPWGSYTWYATEFDGTDIFFGYVKGMHSEWGYFSLKEMEETVAMGCKVERDLWFDPIQAKECHELSHLFPVDEEEHEVC